MNLTSSLMIPLMISRNDISGIFLVYIPELRKCVNLLGWRNHDVLKKTQLLLRTKITWTTENEDPPENARLLIVSPWCRKQFVKRAENAEEKETVLKHFLDKLADMVIT